MPTFGFTAHCTRLPQYPKFLAMLLGKSSIAHSLKRLWVIDLSEFFTAPPFSWGHEEKACRLLEALSLLQAHHERGCLEYRKLSYLLRAETTAARVEEFPCIPVRLFKMYSLQSVATKEPLKTMTSSGTTGQTPSRVLIDKETALAQTKALAYIVSDFIGKKRLPMVILDSKSVLGDPRLFSARGAGILGFSNFGRDLFYALNEKMELDVEGLLTYIGKHRGESILFFGFTFMIWQYFCQALDKGAVRLDLNDATVIHGGGWKKLSDQAITNEVFMIRLRRICGANTRVHNFYGSVEQTGSIYLECEYGNLHASNFSQVIIRDPISFEPLPYHKRGILETVSVLPWSYPGHALLTEDLGEVLGEDDCLCGRKGVYFAVWGRLPQAEVRGCSDTYALDK
jgi:hypothetical protein